MTARYTTRQDGRDWIVLRDGSERARFSGGWGSEVEVERARQMAQRQAASYERQDAADARWVR